jgi:uncharacterized protein (UPF0248 family)
MMPIQDLLQRIRWDPSMSRSRFEIAYLDRVAHRLERVPLSAVQFGPDEPFGFEAVTAEGEAHFIPYHRVREVFQDGALIWTRPPPLTP